MIATGVITPIVVPLKVTALAAFDGRAALTCSIQVWGFVAARAVRAREKAGGAPRRRGHALLFCLRGGLLPFLRLRPGVRLASADFAPKSNYAGPRHRALLTLC